MRRFISLAVLAGAACVAATSALAAGAATPEEFAKRLLGREPGKGATYACFDRVYDAPHLASHPQQNVRAMSLLVVYTVDPKAAADEQPVYQVRIGVDFRRRTHLAVVNGDCQSLRPETDPNGPVAAHCGVACDGGSIDVALKDNGSILVTIPNGAHAYTPATDKDETALHGGFGADDKIFRVDRADMRQCLPLAADKQEKAQMLRAP